MFLAPPVYYGVCTSTGQHPGTIGITPETLRRLVFDIVRDAYKKGLRDFFLVTGHGGGLHSSAMKEAAEILVEELKGIKIAVLCPYDILRKELSELAETPNDSHAGEIETSLMLYLAPELVKGSSRKNIRISETVYGKKQTEILARRSMGQSGKGRQGQGQKGSGPYC